MAGYGAFGGHCGGRQKKVSLNDSLPLLGGERWSREGSGCCGSWVISGFQLFALP